MQIREYQEIDRDQVEDLIAVLQDYEGSFIPGMKQGKYKLEFSKTFNSWMQQLQESSRCGDSCQKQRCVYVDYVYEAIKYSFERTNGRAYNQPLFLILRSMNKEPVTASGRRNTLDINSRQVAQDWQKQFPDSRAAWLVLADAGQADLAIHSSFLSEMYWQDLLSRKQNPQPMFDLSTAVTWSNYRGRYIKI